MPALPSGRAHAAVRRGVHVGERTGARAEPVGDGVVELDALGDIASVSTSNGLQFAIRF
jgi:hypothetical protein